MIPLLPGSVILNPRKNLSATFISAATSCTRGQNRIKPSLRVQRVADRDYETETETIRKRLSLPRDTRRRMSLPRDDGMRMLLLKDSGKKMCLPRNILSFGYSDSITLSDDNRMRVSFPLNKRNK